MTIAGDSTILIVDDSNIIRNIVRKLLTQIGYSDIEEASDGGDALAKIHEKRYGLVISDWNMEPMNGQALLERVRSERDFTKLPFIMMTAESAVRKLINAKYAGVNSFIHKPFNAEALKAKIDSIKIS